MRADVKVRELRDAVPVEAGVEPRDGHIDVVDDCPAAADDDPVERHCETNRVRPAVEVERQSEAVAEHEAHDRRDDRRGDRRNERERARAPVNEIGEVDEDRAEPTALHVGHERAKTTEKETDAERAPRHSDEPRHREPGTRREAGDACDDR